MFKSLICFCKTYLYRYIYFFSILFCIVYCQFKGDNPEINIVDELTLKYNEVGLKNKFFNSNQISPSIPLVYKDVKSSFKKNKDNLVKVLTKLEFKKKINLSKINTLDELETQILTNLKININNIFDLKNIYDLMKNFSKTSKLFTKLSFHAKAVEDLQKFKSYFINTYSYNKLISKDINKVFDFLLNIKSITEEQPNSLEDELNAFIKKCGPIKNNNDLSEFILYSIKNSIYLVKDNIKYTQIKNTLSKLPESEFSKVNMGFNAILEIKNITDILYQSKVFANNSIFARSEEELYLKFFDKILLLGESELKTVIDKCNEISNLEIKTILLNLIKLSKKYILEIKNESNKIPKYNHQPGGITNVNNTCFMNSVLQIIKLFPEIFYCFNSFFSIMKKKVNLLADIKKADSNLIRLQELGLSLNEIKDIDNYQKNKKSIVSYGKEILDKILTGQTVPSNTAKQFHESVKYFDELGVQGDIGEILDKIFSSVPNDYNIFSNYYTAYRKYIDGNIQTIDSSNNNNIVLLDINDQSTDLIEMLEKTYNSKEKDTFEVNKFKNGIIQRLNVYNENMRTKVSDNVTTLIIQLKRTKAVLGKDGNFKNKKILKKIKVPPILQFNDLGTSKLFDLRGVINHSSFNKSSESGHYYSYTKNEEGNWFKENDSYVQNKNLNEVLNEAQSAYLLVYKKKLVKSN